MHDDIICRCTPLVSPFMRIVIITQDDPFYLPGNLDFLLSNLPDGTQVVGCVVSKVSPFGKKERITFRVTD